jgi:hypothetical protein
MMRVPNLAVLTATATLMAAGPAWAAGAFSCDPQFEARVQGGVLDPELRVWIVDTARRFYQERSQAFSPERRAACSGLACVNEQDIVAKVARQCTRMPTETLELAVQKSLRDIILPVIGCDARCAMRLGAQ